MHMSEGKDSGMEAVRVNVFEAYFMDNINTHKYIILLFAVRPARK